MPRSPQSPRRPSAPKHAASSPPSTHPSSLTLSKSTTIATTGSSKEFLDGSRDDGGLRWTKENEARLVYVQGKLKEAQAAWSEEQDLWIDEVLHLEELKRSCLKAEKKLLAMGKRRGNSVAGLLKRPSWGKSGMKMEDGGTRGAGGGGDDDEGDEDSDEDGDEEHSAETSTKATPRRPSLSTLFRRTMSLGSKNRSRSQSRRNTLDGEQSPRPLLTTSPEGSFEGSGAEEKGKGKGKVNVLKRRGSGR